MRLSNYLFFTTICEAALTFADLLCRVRTWRSRRDETLRREWPAGAPPCDAGNHYARGLCGAPGVFYASDKFHDSFVDTVTNLLRG